MVLKGNHLNGEEKPQTFIVLLQKQREGKKTTNENTLGFVSRVPRISDITKPFNMKVSCSRACKHGREMCMDECVINCSVNKPENQSEHGSGLHPPTSLKQASKSGNATYGWSVSLKVSAVAERLEGLWRLVCSFSPQPHQINSSPNTHINRMP